MGLYTYEEGDARNFRLGVFERNVKVAFAYPWSYDPRGSLSAREIYRRRILKWIVEEYFGKLRHGGDEAVLARSLRRKRILLRSYRANVKH